MAAPRVTLVAAMDRNRAIGVEGRLPWHIPGDLKRFKALTMGKTLLMGRKTAESLGRALPGRRNLVLTRSGYVPFDGMQACASWEQASARASGDELYVIGGGEIYALALPHAECMELTHVDMALPRADAWFPAWDKAAWRELGGDAPHFVAGNDLAYRFSSYVRATSIPAPSNPIAR